MRTLRQSIRFILLLAAFMGLAAVFAPPAHADQQIGVTYAAFQRYQHGLMIWRADNGGIWVLMDEGLLARYFPQTSYETLPDNPAKDTPPAGLVQPVNGFGRVWSGFPDVRSRLGWALSTETGYTAAFAPISRSAGGLEQFTVNFPDGWLIVIRSDYSWQDYGTSSPAQQVFGLPRPISSLPESTAFPATIQLFERGFMIWWSETGSVWVLYGSGQAELFDSVRYGALPDNPVGALPPAGSYKPVFGFGKVWGNFPAVRQRLGWATGPEQGYSMKFERRIELSATGGVAISFAINTPYRADQSLVIRDNQTWTWMAN